MAAKLTSALFALALCLGLALGEEKLAFGRNQNGQLGLGKATSADKPTDVASLDAYCILQAASSSENTIVVTCDGDVMVTGLNIGEGDGNYSPAGANAEDYVTVHALKSRHIVMVGAGEGHFVALDNEGRVFTWGLNADGQLGVFGENGRKLPYLAQPTEVKSLSKRNIRFVTAGGNRTAAIADTGKLYIWGKGNNGEMGDGTTASHKKPTYVPGFERERVCQVALGGSHVVAVTNQGDMYTWGDGNAGQLGLGDFGMQRKKPMHVSRLRRNVCFVSAGHDFTSAVTQDERVFLWGSNGYPAPFEKTFFQGLHPVQAGAGSAHMVVLLNNGSVATWGSRRYGQAGRPFSGDFTLEPGLVDTQGASIRQLSVGLDGTLLLESGAPAPSLCPCAHGHYAYWRQQVKYKASCTDEQATCGDGTCCKEGSSCCRREGSGPVSSNVPYRAIDEIPTTSPSAFACVADANAQCCGVQNAYACPNNHKCSKVGDEKVCVPNDLLSASDEDKLLRSAEPMNLDKPSNLPGFRKDFPGKCGARLETCPDETCCPKDTTCCMLDDGTFGCCPHEQAVCCKNGCCKQGYACDEDNYQCIKQKDDDDYPLFEQDEIDGHCGAQKRACPDQSCCPNNQECCVLSDGFFGCCPFANGVCCADGAGCCPSGHKCDIKNSECVRVSYGEFGVDEATKGEVRIKMKATPRNTPMRPDVSEQVCPNDPNFSCQYPGTCCGLGNGGTGCCDFVNATCCEGGLGCCPSDYTCDIGRSMCTPTAGQGQQVPMKFTRDPKPKQTAGNQIGHGEEVCPHATQCDDNTCCPVGATCCKNPDGSSKCCDAMAATCCADGGCCAEGDECVLEHQICKKGSGKTYPYLSSQHSTKPPPSKAVRDASAPSKCFVEEKLCDAGFCCPRESTCCSRGYGQTGCCPVSHGVCCENGGCCPGGSTCDVNSNECHIEGKDSQPMLLPDVPHPPEADWDQEECWDDEQTCPGDGGCCLRTETCCLLETDEGYASGCCPYENGICCSSGGCCPSDTTCDDHLGTCVDVHGEVVEDSAYTRGSAAHPKQGPPDIHCPDGYTCGPFDTCCSLGFDEYWGEEIYACCPYENAVCCTEFEGCCPNGYTCETEGQMCVIDGRELEAGANNPTEPPPAYVCKYPETQCPNGKCCGEHEQCAEMPSGNFKCLERGYSSCPNSTHQCPTGLYCDNSRGPWMCSEERDNDPEVKKELLRKYWGDDVAATCNTLLVQETASVKQGDESFTPDVEVARPPAQYWYPKKLAAVVKAKATRNATLPTLLAAKVCQHLNYWNASAATDICFLSNANGQFLMKDRPRVKQLIDEYKRRMCVEQDCRAPKAPVYTFQAEEIDPCPCRERPTPEPQPTPDVVAGTIEDGEMEQIANEEVLIKPKENALPVGALPVTETPDEKRVSAVGMGRTSSGSIPANAERPIGDEASPRANGLTLSPTTRDSMQSSQILDHANTGDDEMLKAHRPETFMGKEACDDNEVDVAEAAVDLDSEVAVQMDAKADARKPSDVTLAQMNTKRASGGASLMPESM